MKKFMYINARTDGIVLINTDAIEYILRAACVIKMQDGTIFVVKESELDDILTDLEERDK